MTLPPALEARGLTKRYRRQVAVDGLDFAVRPATITGFLGPNGAGKSTTMRLFLGLDRPSAGQALVGGRPVEDWPEPGRQIGAALSNRCAHPGRTARDSMRWIARILDLPDQACAHALERVGLGADADRRTGEFSVGMRQRLALAQALLGEPAVLLLDEPMNGLDPQGIGWLRGLLAEVRAEGRTVLISSHLLREIEDLVDDLVLIADGRVVSSGTMAAFLDEYHQETVRVRCDDVHALATAVRSAGGQLRGAVHGDQITVVGLSARDIGLIARDRGVSIVELSTDRRLEGAFEAATAEPVDVRGTRTR